MCVCVCVCVCVFIYCKYIYTYFGKLGWSYDHPEMHVEPALCRVHAGMPK